MEDMSELDRDHATAAAIGAAAGGRDGLQRRRTRLGAGPDEACEGRQRREARDETVRARDGQRVGPDDDALRDRVRRGVFGLTPGYGEGTTRYDECGEGEFALNATTGSHADPAACGTCANPVGAVVNVLYGGQAYPGGEEFGWPSDAGIMLGVILSATDPVAVVALLKDLHHKNIVRLREVRAAHITSPSVHGRAFLRPRSVRSQSTCV